MMEGYAAILARKDNPLRVRPSPPRKPTPTNDGAAVQPRSDLARFAWLYSNARPTKRCFMRSEEHTSELQSLMRNSYAVFCVNKKTHIISNTLTNNNHKY